MDDNTTTDEWSAYFKYRGVSHHRYHDHRISKYLAAQLPCNRDAKIVDLGCGFGQNIAAIKRLGYTNCVGVEPSAEAGTQASINGIEVFRGTVEDYSASRPQDVKLALMMHVLEHIPRDQIIPILSKIRESILAADGALLIAVPNASSPTHCYWRYEDWTHTCLFTSGSLLYVLRAAGFSKIEILDADCLMEARPFVRPIRRAILGCYKLWLRALWRLTSSSLHAGSPLVLSFEVKALAKK